MKADAASLMPALSAGNGAPSPNKPAERGDAATAQDAPPFDKLLRKPPQASSTRDKPATAPRETETAAPAAPAASGEPASEQQRDDEPVTDLLAAGWPLPGLILPPLPADAGAPAPLPALAPAAASPHTAPGNVLAATPAQLPAANPLAALPGGADAAANADTAMPATSPAPQPSPSAPAAAAPAVTAATENPLPAALLAGFALARDGADALTPGRREETPAVPTGHPLAGLVPSPELGLARTATVNPLTALTPDLHTDQFGETLGTQLSWMAEQKIGHAHIRVSPHDLGTIEVNLRLDGDRVHADFSSAQPEVRQALETSLPRLREMLGQQGFQLAQADVGHRQQSQTPPTPTPSRTGTHGDGPAAAPGPATATIIHRRGLLDAYA